MALQTDYPQTYVLEGQVYFDRQRRHLHTCDRQVELKEHEARLLTALLNGVQDKRQIIELLWESRGVIVTENNYYKVVKGLRNAFSAIGLSSDLLKTLPRVGIAYVGTCEPCLQQENSAPVVVSDLPAAGGDEGSRPVLPLITPTPESRWRKLIRVVWREWLLVAAILAVAILCGSLLWSSDNGFRLLGVREGVKVYVYRDPGIPLAEILDRYRRFAGDQQGMRYLYYRAVGKNYIILACPSALPDGAESCVSLMQKNI
jgi:DNA-binding winged helix-turn-helix (wHTH) protein